jgi:hypothetical protein
MMITHHAKNKSTKTMNIHVEFGTLDSGYAQSTCMYVYALDVYIYKEMLWIF